MNRLPKILVFIFFFFLFIAIGLGVYYFFLTSRLSKTSNEDVYSVQSLLYRLGVSKRVVVESKITGLEIKIIKKDKLEKAIKDTGFWEDVIPAYGSSVRDLVQPMSLKILLTNEEQSGFGLIISKKDSADKKSSKSLGIDYNKTNGQLTLLMHYSPNFIVEKTGTELSEEITKDIVYYLYAIGGSVNITNCHGDFFKEARNFAEEYLSQGESWFNVKKK